MMDKVLPTGEMIAPDKLEKDFVWREVTPENNRDAKFKVFMPRIFSEKVLPNSESSSLEFTTLAHFKDLEGGGTILVQRQLLPREVSAAHWLRVSTLQSGKSINVLNAANVRFADSVVDFVADGLAYRARMAVLVSGGYAFLLIASAPTAQYEKQAQAFGMFIATWELLVPSARNRIEERKRCSLNGYTFEVPFSWKKKLTSSHENDAASSSLVMVNLDDDGELNGVLRFSTRPISDNQTWLEGMTETLAFWESLKLPESKVLVQDTPTVEAKWVEKASMVRFLLSGPGAGTGQFEGWIMLMSDGESWITISLLSPPESDPERFYVWAFNHRAFAISLETLVRM